MTTDRRNEESNLLSRWETRKKAVREVEEAERADDGRDEEPAERAEPQTEEEARMLLNRRDPELARQIDAIDIDELGYDDDFTVFMNARVPDILRRKALSKLWLSHPLLANLDGLNEYDEDYTQAAGAAEMVRKTFEAARLREEEAAKRKSEESSSAKAPATDVREEPETADADDEDEEPEV